MTIQISVRKLAVHARPLLWWSLFGLVEAGPRNFRVGKTATATVAPGVALMIAMGVIVAFLIFLCRVYCPNGPEFTALELDEIRIERLQRIEDRIKQGIKDMKSKLSFHKEKKQKVQKERDLKLRLQNYVLGGSRGGGNDLSDEESNSLEKKGRKRRYPDRSNLFEQESIWNASPLRSETPKPRKDPHRSKESTPLLAAISSPGESRLIEEKVDREEKADYHEEEEKEDLWKMWNSVATEKEIRNGAKAAPPVVEEDKGQKKSYQSIKYGNKAEQKSFASTMVTQSQKQQQQQSFQQQRQVDDYNTGMMYTESQWDAKPTPVSNHKQLAVISNNNSKSQAASNNYSINVAVKDYRSAEKYSVDVPHNPLLAQQKPTTHNNNNTTTSSHSERSAPRTSNSNSNPTNKPPPPKGPPPPHVLLQRKLEKLQGSSRNVSAENSLVLDDREEKDPEGPSNLLLRSQQMNHKKQ